MFDDRELRRMARQMRLALAALTEEQPTRGGFRGRGRRTGEQWFGAEDRAEFADKPRHRDEPGRASRPEKTERTTDQQEAGRDAGPRRADSDPAFDDEPGLHPRGERHGHCGGPWQHHRGFRADIAADDMLREAWRAHREAWLEHCRAAGMAMSMPAEAAGPGAARSEESRGPGPKGERGSKGKHRKHRGPRDEGSEERAEHEEPRDPWGFGGPRGGRPGWGGPGGPFGPFGPFGPGPGGMGRGPRGRGPGWRFEGGRGRAGRGDIRLAILALLSDGPRHGYQLIQDINERSDGAWAPSPGSIYPALSSLQDEGLIDDEKVQGRRVFSLTPAGQAYVAERSEQITGVFEQNSPTSEHEALAEVGKLMWGVGEAALTVLGTGTEAQRAEARDVLARSRRDLFRILAEDTVWTEDSETADQPDPDTEQAPLTEEPGSAGDEGVAPEQAESGKEATSAEASADEAAATGPGIASPEQPRTAEGDSDS